MKGTVTHIEGDRGTCSWCGKEDTPLVWAPYTAGCPTHGAICHDCRNSSALPLKKPDDDARLARLSRHERITEVAALIYATETPGSLLGYVDRNNALWSAQRAYDLAEIFDTERQRRQKEAADG